MNGRNARFLEHALKVIVCQAGRFEAPPRDFSLLVDRCKRMIDGYLADIIDARESSTPPSGSERPTCKNAQALTPQSKERRPGSVRANRADGELRCPTLSSKGEGNAWDGTDVPERASVTPKRLGSEPFGYTSRRTGEPLCSS